ncbi:MAG: Ig-like domain-containing protein [Myxococcales bacterium]|nr:Ig-like domain-containing protein [Myxococcales bacterium]
MSGARVALPLLAVLFFSFSCRDQVNLPPVKGPPLEVPGAKSGGGPGLKSNKPLEISHVTPKGQLTRQHFQITVTFNQPIVPLTKVEKRAENAPLRIEPAVAGKQRWLGARTLAFVPDKPLPGSTKFTLSVPEGVKSISGKTLSKGKRWTFTTARLRVVRSYPYGGYRWLSPSHKVQLYFNQDVSAGRVAKHVTFRVDDGQSKSAVGAVVTPYVSRYGRRNPRAVWVKPKTPLPLDAHVTLHVGDGLRGEEGPLPMKRDYGVRYKTYGPLKITAQSCKTKCDPDSSIRLTFSNPVRRNISRAAIRVSGRALKVGRSRYESTSVYVNGGFKPRRTYAITLVGNVTDKFGQSLTGSRKLTFTTRDYDPYARLPLGSGVAEASGSKLLPLVFRNAKAAAFYSKRLDAAELAKLYANSELRSRYGAEPLISTLSGARKKTLPVGGRANRRVVKHVNLKGLVGGNSGRGVLAVELVSDIGEKKPVVRRAVVRITDMAMTAKYSPHSSLVWITSLASGKPVSGADVAIWRPGGEKPIWRGKTNKDGLAVAPGTLGLGLGDKERTLLFFARHRGDESFVVSTSTENLGPWVFGYNSTWDAGAGALLGMVFSDRGIYRPGETVRLKGILRKRDKGGLTPISGEVKLSISDARGEKLKETTVQLSEFGGLHMALELPRAASLGRYSVRAAAPGGGTVYGSFRVEEYRPAEFEVKVSSERPQYIRGDSLRWNASGRYLFGAPMRRAKHRYTIYRSSAYYSPPGHPGFVFSDESYWYGKGGPRYGMVTRGSGRLDAKGAASGITAIKPAKMTRPERWRLEMTVTDVSRQTVASRTAPLVHPGEIYIGAKPKETFIIAGETLATRIITTKPNGKRVAGVAVAGQLMRREWRQVRKRGMKGHTYFVTRLFETPAGSCSVKSDRSKKGVACDIKIAKAGYYVLRLTTKDKRGNPISASFSAYVSGADYVPWRRKGESKVELVLDRKRYKVGQKARVMIKSPFTKAHALLTVESNGILLRRKLLIKRTATFVEIPVTGRMLPNAFVSVLMVRGRVKGYRRDKKDPTADPGKPVFKAGYAKIVVSQKARRLAVTVKPEREKYRPGETVNVALDVRDAKGRAMIAELTVMVADEGVLSLIGHKTPDPMSVFYAERGLSVRTADNRNQLISPGIFGQKGNPGGGGFARGAAALPGGGKVRSRFVSTPYFNPSVITGADGKAHVSFKLPDNLTTFRVMVVAASKGAQFGSAQSKVTVSKPLLLLPTLPRLVRVGDQFEAGVVIHNHAGRDGAVTISASAQGVTLLGSSSTQETVKDGGAVEARFRFKATSPGKATFSFRARFGDFEDGLKLVRPVKLPLVIETVATSGSTNSSIAEGIVPSSDVRSDVGGLRVTMASSALVGLKGGMDYLLHYPYECVEQTTSRLVPLVTLYDLSRAFALKGAKDPKPIVSKLVARLQKLQRYNGGFSYWPSSYYVAPWSSAYAAWGLLQAKKHNYRVSKAVLDKAKRYLLGYLKRRHGRYRPKNAATRKKDELGKLIDEVGPGLATAAYAAYVLVQMGEAPASYINGLYGDREMLTVFAKAMLLKAMVQCKKCESDSKAMATLKQELSNAVHQTGKSAKVEENLGYSFAPLFHSDMRSTAMVLSALLAADPNHHLVDKLVRFVLDQRSKGRWRNTQETVYALLALHDYYKVREKDPPDFIGKAVLNRDVLVRQTFKGRSLSVKKANVPMKTLLGAGRGTFGFVKSGSGTLHYTASLRYARKTLPSKGWDEGFFVTRTYERIDEDAGSVSALRGQRGNKPQGIFKVKAGDLVRITLRIVVPQQMHFVAVEDPLPAGLEAVNMKLMTATRSYSSALRYGYRSRYGRRIRRSTWYTPFYHREIRDDRVQLFADSLPAGSYTYVYLARATTIGKFIAPPTHAEQMYAPEVFGRTGAVGFTVKAR